MKYSQKFTRRTALHVVDALSRVEGIYGIEVSPLGTDKDALTVEFYADTIDPFAVLVA